jgi:hypothetical protein
VALATRCLTFMTAVTDHQDGQWLNLQSLEDACRLLIFSSAT